MAELDGGLGALGVDGVGKVPEAFPDFVVDIQLAVEGDAAAVHRAIGHGGHPYAAAGNAHVVVLQHLAGLVARAHILEGSAAHSAVAQFDRPQAEWRKELTHISI